MAQTIESAESFARDESGKLTATGQAERWTMEFAAAREKVKPWHRQGDKILDRYLDERSSADVGESRLNLFTANVETQHALLYGKVPGADVTRHFEDADDDVARVAAEMLRRVLTPINASDPYASALSYALEDRLLTGFGFASARYEVETEAAQDEETGETLMDDEGAEIPRKSWENVASDYHYWRDCLWSPTRTFELMRWFAWSCPMTRAALVERFGEDIGRQVPLNSKTGKKTEADAVKSDPWSRADVWEIWSKEDRCVFWYVEGFNRILDQKDDPLGLENFFPFPKPMIAHATTRNFMPRPDFVLAQDLYNEIDVLTTRINLLEKAIRVAGVFDQSAPEVAKILTDAGFNKLYPAQNWAVLAEKGGLKGVVDWFPLEQVTGAIAVLTQARAEKVGLLQQVTGWSDIMRGQTNPNETLGAQQLKSQYGSVRIQRFQAEFATFATDLRRIQAEIISKHFDVQTIIERSNILNTADARFATPAAQLIKDRFSAFRIEVKPENINLTDYAQLKQERTEVIQAAGGWIQAVAPVVQMGGPPAVEFALEFLKWILAGVKGGDGLEPALDAFRTQLQAASAQPKPPDPKLQAEQVRAGAEATKAKLGVVKAIVDAKAHAQKTGLEMQQAQMEHGQAMQREAARTAAAIPPVGPGGANG